MRAVLFDLDGTLLDTLSDLADSMNAVLAEMGFATHPREAYRLFVGDGMETLAQRVLPLTQRTPATIERCVSAMRARYRDHWADRSAPYPGIPELLSALTGLKLSVNILSNKPDELTRLMVDHFLPGWRWDQVRGARPEIAKKPDPAGALAIADQLGLHPHQFLYLGDTNTDMRTAIAAGMTPIGALWGFRDQQELETSGAQTVLHHPLALLSFIGR